MDLAFTLELERETSRATLRIEGRFTLRMPAGREVQLDPENDAAGLGPALALCRATLETSDAHPDGSLALLFANGASVMVPPDPEFEAWTLTISDGSMMVSGPGGRLTSFGGAQPPRAATDTRSAPRDPHP
ncbi:MAG: hypothetical protein JOZ75_02085 [Candidatus Dormibacteraeota bacterium]|nr:hypothetical protein [Candidatus Dormibacteraeota bacterium]